MRRPIATLPLLALLALVLNNCGSDSPTEPDPTPTDTVLAEAVVGQAGDTLSADGVTVAIPDGALGDDHALTLLREREPSITGDTETYRLEGLPGDFGQPLTVTLPMAAGRSGDPEAYLQIDGVTADGDTSGYFGVLPATIVEAGLEIIVQPGDYLLEGVDKNVEDFILDLILTGVQQTARSHVDIPLPIYITGSAAEIPFHQELILTWLVDEAERFLPLTDQFHQVRYPSHDSHMPMIECSLHYSDYFNTKVEGRLQRPEPGSGVVVPHLEVTYNPENGDLELLRWMIHFKLWSLVYEARTALPVDWWLYATLYALYDDIGEGYTDFTERYSTRVLRGCTRVIMEEDDPWTQGMAPYGYGMLHLARWIDRHEGANWGREAFGASVDERDGYTYHDVAHLVDALPQSPVQWWPEFLQDMMTGETGPAPWNRFEPLIEDTWSLELPQHNNHVFSGEQYRLDANLYRIDLQRDDFTTDHSLFLSVVDPQNETVLVVFSLDGEELTPVARGVSVEIDQLDVLAALDEDLIVVTANAGAYGDWQTSRTIEVQALLDDGQGLPDVTTFREISVQVVTDNTHSVGYTLHNDHLHASADVAWNGNGLYAAYAGYESSDTAAVIIDPATLALTSFNISSIHMPNSFTRIHIALAGGAVPVDEWGVDQYGTIYVNWTIRGDDEVCSRLTRVHFAEWYDDVLHDVLTEYDCHESEAIYDTSSIHITALLRTQ